jgi:hypothetical protein
MATVKKTAVSKSGTPAAGSRNASAHVKSESRSKAASKDTKKDTCFVISPFGGWHDEYHREIFCAAIKAAGLDPVRSDDLFRSSNIVHDIWHLVASSRVLLADLTGKNPNVFYELGLAHAARKPVLLLTQSMDDVPFDLRALRVITYDVEHPAWGALLKEQIKAGLQETLESPERSVLPTFLLETPEQQTPTVTQDEKRFLDLQQQVDSLRAEVRGGNRKGSPAPSIITNSVEAQEAIERYSKIGMSRKNIERRLRAQGVPLGWLRSQLDALETISE